MNCRVIICAFALVLDLSCEPIFLQAAEAQPLSTKADAAMIDWVRLQNERMKIQDFSSGGGDVRSTYPTFLQTIYTRLLDWEPRVNLANSTEDQVCRLSFSSSDLKTRVSEMSQFLQEKPTCAFRDGANQANGIKKLFQALSVHFDVTDTNHFRKVIFRFQTEDAKPIQVRGLLGLHDDLKSRPLVILRLGVHGNVDEFLAERYIGKAAYEDFEFNILVLENLTSHGYLSQNNPITFGGVEEGLHTFEILRLLKDKNFFISSLISDVHLFGISLGAHGAFVTTMMDEANENYLKSATVYCPMVNLEETMSFHAKATWLEASVDLWNHMRLRALPERVEELQHTGWWQTVFDLKPRFMPAILDYLNAHQKKPAIKIAEDFKWPQGFKHHLETSKSFFELNSFWPFFENKKTPLLIVTTPNDPLVPLEINTNLIVQKKQAGLFERTQVLQLQRGVHCGLPVEYQWNFILDLLKLQWASSF